MKPIAGIWVCGDERVAVGLGMLNNSAHQTSSERVRALRESGLLTRSQRDEFGHLTDLVRDVLDAPVALVTLVDEDRQVFAGHSGLPEPWDTRGETPMTHSFCQHVVERGAPLVVTDARRDPLVLTNLAIDDLGVEAYLGVPLALPDGEIVGALAAIDTAPRDWTDVDMRRLRSIARSVEREMAARISEGRWRLLFENMQEGFVLARVLRDETGRIHDWRYEEVNAAWYDLLGVPPSVVGRTLREVLPTVEDFWIDEFAGVVETGRPVRFVRQVGSLGRWYEGVAQSVDGDRFTVIFMDATDRIKRDRRQAALLTLGDELRGRSDPERIVTAAARCLADGLEVDRVGYGLANPRAEGIGVRLDWCEPGVPSLVGGDLPCLPGMSGEALRREDIAAIDDLRAALQGGGEASEAASLEMRSALHLPIRYDDRLYAMVFAHSRKRHPWTDGELQFVRQVADRVRVSLARQQAEDSQRVLTQEMAHRMKNSLAMVQAIATQTLRQSATMEEGRTAISQRLGALARAQDILTRTSFTDADVREVVEAAMAPHQTSDMRIASGGPSVRLTSQQALGLSLAIHELATNAAKYGALSTETGRVDLTWRVEEGAFVFEWIESGGPLVIAPDKRGFGSRLIERIVGSYFDGEGRISFDPSGIRFKLTGAAHRHGTTA